MLQNATKRYNQTPHAELSQEQLNAIDLLLAGATDQHVADTVGVHRVTVTRWRRYHPHFRAALVSRRREAHGGTADAFRTVIPLALDTLRDQLRVGPSRGSIALNLLHKAGLTNPALLSGADLSALPTQDEDQILAELLDAEVRRQRTAASRSESQDPDDDFADFPIPPDAPVSEAERQEALRHLLALSAEE